MPTTVTLKTPDGDMGLYDVEPDGEARAAVIVAQEAFGVNPHIEDVTRRVAAAGYRAVAPHLFHRTGDPVIDYGDFDKIMPQFAGLSEAGVLNDLDAALAYLGEAGFAPARIGVVGFCMGGTVAFLASVRRPLGAGVTFYGGGVTEGRFGMASHGGAGPRPPGAVAGPVRRRRPGDPGRAGRGPADGASTPRRWTPRSCATPAQVTGSTATCGTTTTSHRQRTPGDARSPGSSGTCPGLTATGRRGLLCPEPETGPERPVQSGHREGSAPGTTRARRGTDLAVRTEACAPPTALSGRSPARSWMVPTATVGPRAATVSMRVMDSSWAGRTGACRPEAPVSPTALARGPGDDSGARPGPRPRGRRRRRGASARGAPHRLFRNVKSRR